MYWGSSSRVSVRLLLFSPTSPCPLSRIILRPTPLPSLGIIPLYLPMSRCECSGRPDLESPPRPYGSPPDDDQPRLPAPRSVTVCLWVRMDVRPPLLLFICSSLDDFNSLVQLDPVEAGADSSALRYSLRSFARLLDQLLVPGAFGIRPLALFHCVGDYGSSTWFELVKRAHCHTHVY